MTFCFATNNPNKINEVKAVIGNEIELLSLEKIGFHGEIPETGNTLEYNSKQKASYIFEHFHINTIADDSGLEVEALHGEPGVRSARFAGEHGNDKANTALLLEKLKNETNRKAQFRTVITCIKGAESHQFEGIIEGKIANSPAGSHGFGYDPVFIPDGYDHTFAQMTPAEKNQISHRSRAIKKLSAFLKNKPLNP